jgi:hypothetical protein
VAADAGGKWSTAHPRVWRFKKGFHHKDSFNYFVDENDNKVKNPNYGEYEWDKDEPIYHFGYAREKKYIFQKLNYYKNRGIEKIVDINIYESWKIMEDSTQPTQNVRSWAKKFNKDLLPKIMVNHIYYNQNDIRKI